MQGLPTATDPAAAPLSVTYLFTADEVYRVGRILLPRWITFAIDLGFGLFLVAGIVLVVTGFAGLGVLFVIIAIVVLGTRPVAHSRQMRRISKLVDKLPGLSVVTIGPDGLHQASGASSSLTGWADIVSVDLRRDFVWVQGRIGRVCVIPSRAFDGPADVDRFVATARGYLSGQPMR